MKVPVTGSAGHLGEALVRILRGSGREAEYGRRVWRMFPSIDRGYVNRRARDELGWQPRYDFVFVLDRLKVCTKRHDYLGSRRRSIRWIMAR
jgi:nucleoside-diphosphate-sugar epimerase